MKKYKQVKIVCKIKYILIFMISKYKLTSPIKTFFSSLFLWSSYSTEINPPFLSLDSGNFFGERFPMLRNVA